MAILKRGWLAGVAVVCSIAVASCLGGGEPAEPEVVPSPFSHAVHVGERGLACSMCHTADGSQVSMPRSQICLPCHAPVDDPRQSSSNIAQYFDDSGRYLRQPIAELADELRFDHAAHGTDCSACHGDIAHSAGIPLPRIAKDDCLACHDGRRASNDCAVCHTEISKTWSPPSHRQAWAFRHGQVFRSQDEAPVNRCAMCHDEEKSCTACHREQKPRDHTNQFRLRGHGLLASIDRNRCAMCHRPDYCQACHENVRPISHAGTFGSPRNRHCGQCHFPLAATGCVTCHKAAPQHLTEAKPMPPDHNPAMNCRMCHGAGVRLPHFDPGTACTACHR